MPTWLGTLIALTLVGAMIVIVILSLVREKRKGKGCCGGCAGCTMSCSAKQKEAKIGEKTEDIPPEKSTEL
ncbi:MAG: FeoB-associated Cys-rich membrane protein [Clostridia bacterium]|nr:FeoB-associated Cys-rich membrane protein [Clostridia bacterium]